MLRGLQLYLPVGILNNYPPAAICSHPPTVTNLKSCVNQGNIITIALNRMALSQVEPALGTAAQLKFSSHCYLWNPDYGLNLLMMAEDVGVKHQAKGITSATLSCTYSALQL